MTIKEIENDGYAKTFFDSFKESFEIIGFSNSFKNSEPNSELSKLKR